MKNKLTLAAAVFSALVSCDYLPEKISEPVSLKIETPVISPTSITVNITPGDDRVYYIYSVTNESVSPKEFLSETMESLGVTYDGFKEYPWKNHAYVCTFSDFALFYAKSSYSFVGLDSGKEYTIYASCLDTGTNPPTLIGDIYSKKVKTMALEDVPTSDVVIDIMLQDTESAFRAYYKPLLNGKLDKNLYLCWYVEKEETIFSEYGSLDEYFSYSMSEATYTEYFYSYDIREVMYDYSLYTNYFEEGKKYIAWAVTYSKDALEHVYYVPFTYERGMRIDYTHEVYKCK